MSDDARFRHPETPFPVGVEYYRGPTPRQDVWDGDFARIRAAGFKIVRSFSMWNHMEPQQGKYELEDFDLMFDLAEKHGLSVWMDVALATHGACPEWLTRRHPDINVVNHRGERLLGDASAATPQGSQAHCYDHPAWRRYAGDLLRHVIERYKDRPNLLIWGIWDGVAPPSADGSLCYCDNTRARYKDWLRGRFTLDELNEHTLRRYRTWDVVEPPRSAHNVVESLLFKRFHYENLAAHLQWMVGEARSIDPNHEMRAHAAWNPRPWDETCAPHVDSWGMSMPSNELLTSNDPYKIADRAFAFDWSRSVGSNGRWWNEEIYAGMHRGGVTWKKQSDPRELTTLLWMTLVGGAAGTMFWQYRPEYLSFESPGYNLMALDGAPTPRFEAVTRAVAQIEAMSDHLPLDCPKAEVAVVYHPESQELFGLDGENDRYLADVRGAYRTLWTHGIPADVVTPNMDWSRYRLILLPNLALMTEEARSRIERTLADQPDTRIVAEGSFGMYQMNGASSYGPPEGFADILGARVADLSRVTDLDIARGRNVLQTSYGSVVLDTECGYAVLEPTGDSEAVATLDGQTVGVRTADGRFTWLGLTLSAGFGDVASPLLTLGLAADAGISAPVSVEGDRVVPVVRDSRKGGRIIFAFNIESTEALTTLKPQWSVASATDLLTGAPVPLDDGVIHVTIPPWELAVIYCA